MGHCTLAPSQPNAGFAASPEATGDPDCPPEHAKMGHCTPKSGSEPVADASKSGTDLPAGDAPAPAPPDDWYADRIFPASEMARSRDEMMKENGGQTLTFLSFNLAEYIAGTAKAGMAATSTD